MAENCVRVPREEAEKMGWVARAGKRLREAKDKFLSTSSGNKLNSAQDARDLSHLMDYADLRHGIVNEADTIRTRLRSYREGDRVAGTKQANDFYAREAQDFVDNGGAIKRKPTSPEDAVALGQHYAEMNARRRFRDDAVKNGVIGKVKNNPNFKLIPGRGYQELKVRGNPGEQYGILPHLRGHHEDVFSALDRSQKPWGPIDFLRKGRAISTAALMWTPLFHTINIGSRWVVPLLWRWDMANIPGHFNILGKSRTRAAHDAAMRDLADPQRAKELGEEGLIKLGPHGWKESGVPQIRDLFYKLPGAEKVLGPFIRMVDKSMPTLINYMGHVAYHLARNDMMRKGVDPKMAGILAARKTSILMGTIAKDSMTRGWRNFADAALFSTRYTTTSLQLFSRALAKDEALRTRLKAKGFDPDAINRGLDLHRQEFQNLLVKDYISMLVFANAMNMMFTGLYGIPDKNGKKGSHPIWDNPGSNWYKNAVNVKFIIGVDPKTNKPIMGGNPFRSTRDIAELLTDWYAIASGADQGHTIAQSYLNKTNQFWQLFLDVGKGTDWAGKSLNMPTTPETVASWAGNVVDRTTPLTLKNMLVASVSRMESGDPAVWQDVVNSMDDQSVKELVKTGLIRAFGGQTSQGEAYGEPKQETYAAQERVMSWLATPEIRTALAKGDAKITQLALQHLARAGIVGINAQKKLEYAIKQGAGTTPTSKSVRVYDEENK